MDKKKNFGYYNRMFWMDFGHWLVVAFNTIVRKPKVIYMGNERKLKGGTILCANHTGYNDPVVLHTVFWYRRLYFLASELAMRNRLMNLLLGGAGCIRIDRNISDIQSMRTVVDHLKSGDMVGIFPQGTVFRDESMDSIKSGVVLMALQSEAPIIPIYLSPKKNFFTRRRVIIGEELNCRELCTKKLPSMKDINMLTEELFKRMWDCRNYYEEHILNK